jgi:hypothetical protein
MGIGAAAAFPATLAGITSLFTNARDARGRRRLALS